MRKLKLPARMFTFLNGIKLEFPIPNKWGYSLKVVLRNAAKNIPEYHLPIVIEPYVTGVTDDGKVIEINTLGRWLFGVPGYMGHIIVEGGVEDRIVLHVPNIPIVINMIKKAIQQLRV